MDDEEGGVSKTKGEGELGKIKVLLLSSGILV